MKMHMPSRLGLAVPVALLSSTAFADVTPQGVWSDMRQYMEGMGYQMTATETVNGSDVTVSNLTMNVDMPEGAGNVSVSMGSMEFKDNGNGTVALVMPDTMPMQVSVTERGASTPVFTASLDYKQSGHSMIISGDPDDMTYEYNADTMSIVLGEITAEGETIPAENAVANIVASGLSSTTKMIIGDLRNYTQTAQIENVTYDMAFSEPGGSDGATIKGGFTDFVVESKGDIPLTLTSQTDINAMIKAGFDIVGSYAFGSSNVEIGFTDRSDTVNILATSGAGSLGVEMGLGGLSYAASQDDVKVTATLPDLPFPVEYAAAETGFKLAMPVMKSDEPQDFALGFRLIDMTISDMIWSMLDPGEQLPRTPATIDLDITGQAKLLLDLMDPEAAEQMMRAQPAEPVSLDLNRLIVSVAGAELQGNGGITVDADGPPMIPGVGMPVGSVELSLEGAEGLMDKLVAMGLLPQDQVMGARMMLGLFAVPGDAPDTYTSKLEATADGQILANGQRIQ